MKIAVGTTNMTLKDLPESDYEKISKMRERGSYKVRMKNVSSLVKIYVEHGEPAKVSDGYELSGDDTLSIDIDNIDSLNFIASSSGGDLRLLVI